MIKILLEKIKDAAVSVLPVAIIVFLLNLTPLISLSWKEFFVFIVCALLLILGIGLFNLGADIAMTPMGEHIGAGLTKSRSIKLLLIVCFLMGVLITVAEPDLTVLAKQVESVMDGTALIVCVGVGVGIFLLLSVMKIIFKKPLSSMLLFFYMALFCCAALLLEKGSAGLLFMW